jgi:hypothetical protein
VTIDRVRAGSLVVLILGVLSSACGLGANVSCRDVDLVKMREGLKGVVSQEEFDDRSESLDCDSGDPPNISTGLDFPAEVLSRIRSNADWRLVAQDGEVDGHPTEYTFETADKKLVLSLTWWGNRNAVNIEAA